MKGAGSVEDGDPKRRVTEQSATKETIDDVLEGMGSGAFMN